MSLYQLKVCDTVLVRAKCAEPLGSIWEHVPQSNWFLWIWMTFVRGKGHMTLVKDEYFFKRQWLSESENQQTKSMQCHPLQFLHSRNLFLLVYARLLYLLLFSVFWGLTFLSSNFLRCHHATCKKIIPLWKLSCTFAKNNQVSLMTLAEGQNTNGNQHNYTSAYICSLHVDLFLTLPSYLLPFITPCYSEIYFTWCLYSTIYQYLPITSKFGV